MLALRKKASGREAKIPGYSPLPIWRKDPQSDEMGIFFTKNGVYQGIAFRRVPAEVGPVFMWSPRDGTSCPRAPPQAGAADKHSLDSMRLA